MSTAPTELSISDVALRSGVAPSALRFYDDRGLLQSDRTASGHRRFARPVLRRIAFIVAAQKLGLSLAEIGGLLERLPPERAPSRAEWGMLTADWEQRIDDRIEHLERLRRGLTECIGCGCLSLDRCPLANPDDQAAAYGPGPALWR